MKKHCEVEGCTRKARDSGFCGRHWRQERAVVASPAEKFVDAGLYQDNPFHVKPKPSRTEYPFHTKTFHTEDTAVCAGAYLELARLAAKENAVTLEEFVGAAVTEASKAVLLKAWSAQKG